MHGADFVITIMDRSRCQGFIAWYQSREVVVILSALGHGTATTEVLDCLGLEATEKAVLFCISPHAKTRQLVRDTARELWLDVPGSGIVMTVPISSIAGTALKDYLTPAPGEEATPQAMEKNTNHELIVVIANQGYTDLVMEAARSQGATGGTVIHAKGAGVDLARKFFGVSIASEKEIVFILAHAADKNAIMKAVVHQAGAQSEAQSLVFSLPVSDLAGLRTLEEPAAQ